MRFQVAHTIYIFVSVSSHRFAGFVVAVAAIFSSLLCVLVAFVPFLVCGKVGGDFTLEFVLFHFKYV